MTAAWQVPIHTVAAGLGWAEGPVYLASAGSFVFSDVATSTMWRWSPADQEPAVFRSPSHHANGNAVDAEGRLVTCEHQTRRVTRTEADGSITVVADSFEGRPLNSPNDVIVARDGAIWFTDPPYGLLRGECGPDARQEQPVSGVYRCDPHTGAVALVIDCLDKPNGLGFSPDERILYVSDTGHSHRAGGNHHIFRFDFDDKGTVGPLTVFAEILPAASDGFKLDSAGKIWTSAGDGVHCYAGDGVLVGRIELGEMATNLCFLPAPQRGLFVTTPSRALVCDLSGVPEFVP